MLSQRLFLARLGRRAAGPSCDELRPRLRELDVKPLSVRRRVPTVGEKNVRRHPQLLSRVVELRLKGEAELLGDGHFSNDQSVPLLANVGALAGLAELLDEPLNL